MSQNMTTISKMILGPGHVVEDKDPIPVVLRKTKLDTPVELVQKKEDVKSESPKK